MSLFLFGGAVGSYIGFQLTKPKKTKNISHKEASKSNKWFKAEIEKSIKMDRQYIFSKPEIEETQAEYKADPRRLKKEIGSLIFISGWLGFISFVIYYNNQMWSI